MRLTRQVLADRRGLVAALVAVLPTLVSVTVVDTGVPPGTWSNEAPRSSIPGHVPALAAVTVPPLPLPVEKHETALTPSLS